MSADFLEPATRHQGDNLFFFWYIKHMSGVASIGLYRNGIGQGVTDALDIEFQTFIEVSFKGEQRQ